MIKLKTIVERSVPRRMMEEEDDQHSFNRGYKLGKKDYIQGYEREINPDHYPEAFVKGYKKGWAEERRKRWWDNLNAKMTDLLGRMGSSRLR